MAALATDKSGKADLVGPDQPVRDLRGKLARGKRQANRHILDPKDTVKAQMLACGDSITSKSRHNEDSACATC